MVRLVLSTLDGCRLKIDRACLHIKTLEDEIAGFVVPDEHRVVEHEDAKTGGYSYGIERYKTPPEWGVIVGDIAHNLRSCIEHVACNIWVRNGRDSGDSFFPLYVTARQYLAECQGWGLSSDDERLFRQFQPYQRGNAADSHPLRLLNKMSNIDKHQVVHTAALSLEQPPAKPFRVIKEDPETGAREHIYGPPEYPVKEIEVAVTPGVSGARVYAKGDFPVTVEIRQPGTILHEQRVVPLMHDIRTCVSEVIKTFAPIIG
jgi:hypothetical protein